MRFCVKPLQSLSFLLILVTAQAYTILHGRYIDSREVAGDRQNNNTKGQRRPITSRDSEIPDAHTWAPEADGPTDFQTTNQPYLQTTHQTIDDKLNLQTLKQPDEHSTTENESSQSVTVDDDEKTNVVTIAVVGRSGSGVSSTIRELVGLHTECTKPAEGNETFPDIVEYTVEIPSVNGSLHQLKILDVPGFIDGRSLEQDSQILASLKYYVQTAPHPPDFYLALSKFDDNRMDGIHSLFVQFLKRVELFHDVFLNNTLTKSESGKVIFLLTRLMSETRANQRKPQEKIGQFRRIIQEYTQFPSPISIVVGENKAETEYEAKVENGYYKLPNRELYPKNIWQALINASSNSATTDLLTAIMESREAHLKCEQRLISPATEWEHFDDDADAFYYLQSLTNITVEDTDINRNVEELFEKNKNTQMEEIIQKIALQLRLQQENITTVDKLPKNFLERAAFFQNNKQFSATIPAYILNDAFNLTMPEYTQALTVGYGYVLMSDEIATQTPFRTDIPQPSPIGYQIPNFMKCRKLVRPEIQYFKSYSTSMPEYVQERLKYLDFRGKDNANLSSFTVKVKEGFNFQPEKGENVVSLTAVEEHRTLTCKLVPDRRLLTLSPEFVEEVDTLMKFDRHDRDSVNEWKNWFNKWGSHIVVHSYGGGRLHGSIVGSEVWKVLESQSSIDETLNSIVKFTPLSENLGAPSYRMYGGKSDEKSTRIHSLDESTRKELIKKWEESLNTEFIMLTNEFRLQPISRLITDKFGKDKGQIVNEALSILIRGNLIFSRKRNNDKPSGSTRRPAKQGSGHGIQQSRPTTLPATAVPTPDPDFSHVTPPTAEHPERNGFPANVSADETQTALQNQLEDLNVVIRDLKKKVEDKKNRDEEQHQRDVLELQQLQEERKRLSERRRAEMDESDRLATQNRRRMYGSHIERLQQESQSQLDIYQQQIALIRKRNEENERAHQSMITKLKHDRIEKDKRKKERDNKCVAYKFWNYWNGVCKELDNDLESENYSTYTQNPLPRFHDSRASYPPSNTNGDHYYSQSPPTSAQAPFPPSNANGDHYYSQSPPGRTQTPYPPSNANGGYYYSQSPPTSAQAPFPPRNANGGYYYSQSPPTSAQAPFPPSNTNGGYYYSQSPPTSAQTPYPSSDYSRNPHQDNFSPRGTQIPYSYHSTQQEDQFNAQEDHVTSVKGS